MPGNHRKAARPAPADVPTLIVERVVDQLHIFLFPIPISHYTSARVALVGILV